jgi:small subunit ribosomal protein S8
MNTDPIADLLTRIRNANRNRAASCTLPASKVKVRILDTLKREGFIENYTVHSAGPKSVVEVALKYGPEGEQVITDIQRYSKVGCRRYRGCADLPKVRGGMGICVVSTNKGVLSDRECRAQKLGGEVLCTVQ